MNQHKTETKKLLLFITKNSETLIKKTHTKPQETLEFKVFQPREAFSFNPPISIGGSWMIGLTTVKVYNSILNITVENNKFDFYTDTFDEFSFE